MSMSIEGCKLLVNEWKCLVGAKDLTESFVEDLKSELPQLFMDAEQDLDWDGAPDAWEHHNKPQIVVWVSFSGAASGLQG